MNLQVEMIYFTNSSNCFRDHGGGRVVRRCCVDLQCRGILLIWIISGQGPIVLAVGATGGCLDIFLTSVCSLFCPSLGDGPI